MVVSWDRDLKQIADNDELSAAEKQEQRRKLELRYQEYEHQFNQIVERQRAGMDVTQ